MAITQQNIIDYVMTTPENTNPAILIQLLNEYQAGDNLELVTTTIPPTTESQTVTAATGKAFSAVTVNAVTAAIDENLVAENIKNGVTILGVEGTYTGETEEEQS